mmetsp:Transcript_14619/g.21480  ORF Transcript_14619/g.21480 Transcript_14619/m.21480 type:complete len:166 (-) Transcript_14619:105-602(-)
MPTASLVFLRLIQYLAPLNPSPLLVRREDFLRKKLREWWQKLKSSRIRMRLKKQRLRQKNQLEAYLYNLKGSISDQLEGKLSADEKESLSTSVEDALIWLEDNPAAEKDEYDAKQKEVESIANPILKKAYESVNNPENGGGDGDDDFMGEDLDGVDDGPSVEEVD